MKKTIQMAKCITALIHVQLIHTMNTTSSVQALTIISTQTAGTIQNKNTKTELIISM